MPRFAKPSTYMQALQEAGATYIANQPTGRYADIGQWLRGVGFVAALVASYAAILVREPDWWSFPLAAIAGFLAYLMIINFGHDASHGSLGRNRFLNRTILFFSFAVVGVSGALWARRHLRSHHMFPNTDGNDIDADSTSLLRLTPYHPWRPWFRWQAFYAPFLYMLLLAHLAFVEDFAHLAKARRESPKQFRTWQATVEFAATKIIHVGVAIAIPIALIDAPVIHVLAGYALASITASFVFVMLNIGSHICDESEFVKPDDEQRIEHDWATHQAVTAVDWAPTNPVALALTGGANAHAAHHLFMQAAHCHNAGLTRIVADCARRFGKPHHVVTLSGMVRSHFRHLNKLAKPVSAPG